MYKNSVTNSHIAKYRKLNHKDKSVDICKLTPRIFCKDGANLSVQASRYHYCSPREDFTTYYDEVEVGYPSEILPSEFYNYFDGGKWEAAKNGTNGVFAYVPVELIDKYVEDHGGLDENLSGMSREEYIKYLEDEKNGAS